MHPSTAGPLKPTPGTAPVAHSCLVKPQLTLHPPGRAVPASAWPPVLQMLSTPPGSAGEVSPPLSIFPGPGPGRSEVQMAGGTKEKPSPAAPPGKARQQGSTRNPCGSCQLPPLLQSRAKARGPRELHALAWQLSRGPNYPAPGPFEAAPALGCGDTQPLSGGRSRGRPQLGRPSCHPRAPHGPHPCPCVHLAACPGLPDTASAATD